MLNNEKNVRLKLWFELAHRTWNTSTVHSAVSTVFTLNGSIFTQLQATSKLSKQNVIKNVIFPFQIFMGLTVYQYISFISKKSLKKIQNLLVNFSSIANVSPAVVQMLWAETAEVGCGLSYYKNVSFLFIQGVPLNMIIDRGLKHVFNHRWQIVIKRKFYDS